MESYVKQEKENVKRGEEEEEVIGRNVGKKGSKRKRKKQQSEKDREANDKEKCLEKLNQMEKYLPFLDFMINKIKKKNNEISLECQLSKFQLLRSMISEKNGKYTWDVIVKVEDVIKKLIAKLDYKEQCNSPNNESTGYLGGKTETKGSQVLLNTSNESECKSEMAASISIIPSSSTTTISVANATSLPCVTTVDSRPHHSHNNPVDLIMKTLKISVENHSKNNEDGERGSELLSDSLSCTQPHESKTKTETFGKSLETDLDKDLDGFELTDCNTFSEAASNKTPKDSSSSEVPVKASSHVDLLSSSREKLLKSLQKKLYPNKSDSGSSSQSSTKITSEHSSDPQSISAFSCPSNRINPCDVRTKSGKTQAEVNSEKAVSSSVDKHGSQSEGISNAVRHASTKNLYFDSSLGENKQPVDLGNSSSDFNSKQKIREKLSADICEVYRVPGKSVGGSLRSLKDVKDHHKKLPPVEEELFKPDKITEVSSRSSGSSSGSKLPNDNKDKQAEKSHRKPSTSKNEKKDEKPKDKKSSHSDKHSNSDAKLDKGSSSNDKKSKHPKASEGKCDETETSKNSRGSQEKSAGSSSHSPKKSSDENSKKEQKTNEMNNVNDEELMDFVKENMQFLPHLSKLKSSELRKAVDSSSLCTPSPEPCLPSDDSFQDLEEFMSDMSSLSEKIKANPVAHTEENPRNKRDESHTPIVKTSEGSEGSVKNANSIVESSKNIKPLGVVESKANIDDKAEGVNLDGDEEFAQNLIEETTPKVSPTKKKGLLELPMPKIDGAFDIHYSKSKTYSNFSSKVKTRDPRKRKTLLPLPLTYQNKPIPSLLDGNFMNFEPCRMGNDSRPGSNVHFNPGMQKDSLHNPRLGGEMGFQTSSQLRTYSKTKARNFLMPKESIHRDGQMVHADPRLAKSSQSHLPQDLNQFPPFNSRYPAEQPNFMFQHVSSFSNSITNTAYNCEPSKSYGPRPSEPKSYAEYKRMKNRRLKQEQTGHFESSHTEKAKNNSTDSEMPESVQKPEDKNLSSNNSGDSRLQEEKVDKNTSSEHSNASGNCRPSENKSNLLENSNVSAGSLPGGVNNKGNVTSSKRHSNRKYYQKNKNSRDSLRTSRTPDPYDNRKKIQEERRHSDNADTKTREDSRSRRNNFEEGRRDERKISGEKETDESTEERKKNLGGDRKSLSDSEEFVSPLDKLYQSENKPKTGRGYGLQSFKIPKKSHKSVPNVSVKSKEKKVVDKEQNSNVAKKEVMVNTAVKQDSQNRVSDAESEVPCTKKISEEEIVEKDKKDSEKEEKDGEKEEKDGEKEEKDGEKEKKDGEKEEKDSCEDSQVNTVSTTKPDTVTSEVADNEKTTQDSCASECKTVTENATSEQCDAEVKSNLESVASSDADPKDKVDTTASVASSTEVKEQTEGDASKNEMAPVLEISSQNEVSEPIVTVTSSETKPADTNESVKKVKAQIIECDSSVVNNTGNNDTQANDNTNNGKGTVVSKEEITQEFVEALIRKSFQSGEGKLLLAQAKLFEEFARKLNSKKLKTIQKIINSESDSSSSESSESSSEDEKKKKKSKEKTVKGKKHKRKLRRIKRLKSSSSESEESSEEEIAEKKEDETKEANPESESASTTTVSPAENKDLSTESVTSTIEINNCDQTALNSSNKTNNTKKKRRRAVIFGKCIKKKRQRKQGQKKLLEQILSETSQSEVDRNSSNSPDVQGKEAEQKSKPKPKAKVKTELDRLHDDIRSMFISSGVVTATGQRMCRILRESGGNMNNLDIVKESAKMVEEEKLKKVQTRGNGRNSRSANSKRQESRSRSQSRDKAGTSENTQDDTTNESLSKDDDSSNKKMTFDNFHKQPYVVLHKVDLNNFGYGRKISEERISFSQKKGSNKALRSKSWGGCVNKGLSRSSSYVKFAHNVYLPRNLRKCERMRDKSLKGCYKGKRLMDIIKNLPLKMAKMRHLEIGEVKPNEKIGETKRKKSTTTKSMRIDDVIKQGGETKGAVFDTSKLLDYTFKKTQVVYPCKLCSHVTKNITAHYKTFHPESEILISRLGRTEARKAIAGSKKNNLGASSLNQSCFLEMIRQRVKSKLDGTVAYHCRMCNSGKISDVNSFFSHVSGHTGEFRYQCPSEGCAATMSSRENMKFHITWNHSKAKNVLFKKIIELFPVPVEMGNLYGYLCSKCHFVQILHDNLQEHVSKQHSGENIKIIKIDMSAKKPSEKKDKSGNAGKKSGSTNPSEDYESTDSEGEDDDLSDGETGENEEETLRLTRETAEKSKTPTTRSSKKRKINESLGDEEDEGSGAEREEGNVETKGNKRRLMQSNAGGIEDSSDFSSESPGEALEVEKEQSHEDETVKGVKNVGMDCADLKGISDISGGDIIGPLEVIDKPTADNSSEVVFADRKLKVGPFEAQTLENSEVLYECCLRGCHFFTKVLDLFEKHVKISHSLEKWNGICRICLDESEAKVYPCKSYRLITALKHLKLHQGIESKDDEISPEDLKIDARVKSRESFDESEEGFSELITKSETIGETEKKSEVSADPAEGDKPFPEKPLLRVRNFLGDRLSKPKDFNDVSGVSNDMVTVNETVPNASIGNAVPERKLDPPVMFTIENVRSLKAEGESEESEIHIGEECPNVNILKELTQKVKTKFSSTKPVVVRSCPPRKIAIRPEPSTLPVEVSHPIVPNSSPVAILNSMPPHLTSIPKFTVKSVMVSASSSFLTAPSVASALCSAPSSVVTTASVVTISSAMETNPNKKPGLEDISSSASKPTASVTVEPSKAVTGQPRSPKKRGPTTVYRPSGGYVGPSSFESEDAVTSDANVTPRLHPASTMGSKSVKDVNIYREMLTKKKLCHLFKCMAIECSFTCNNESVFTQHIGLHEVQRRMKNQKKAGQGNALAKLKTVYNWQQCAYCCQVISNTSSALSQHIVIEHGHCMYQCAYCFYRAMTYNYVEIHQNLSHNHIIKNTTRVIYKCKALSVAPPLPSKALEKHGRRQSVRPYHCYQCRSKFYITQDFMNHLTTEHQSVTAYTCHICENLCFKADRLIIHYKLHSYCTYQCAYCLHGTETEKEMVYHLCNFHFSQPAFMYVRALADNQNSAEVKRSHKKKKPGCTSLDSLKVIIYDMHTTNPEYVVEADSEEETVEDTSRANESLEFSSIVAELGINTESEPGSGVSPLIKELASISGNKSPKNLSVKSLLPNAHFSSGTENGAENCSVLISSGLSTDQNDEKDISIPLGQLPLEAISVRNVKSPPVSSPNNIGSQDKNLKLNEIIINLQHKEKGFATPSAEEEKPDETMFKKSYASDPKCIHKLPPVVLSRKTTPKNLYPPKSSSLNKKKLDESSEKNGSAENKSLPALRRISGSENQAEEAAAESTGRNSQEKENNSSGENSSSKNEKNGAADGSAGQPLITNVVSLTSNEFDKQDTIAGVESEGGFPKISDVCSLSKEPSKIVINIKSKLDIQQALKPPIIRVEDFRINEGDTPKSTIVDCGKEKVEEETDENVSNAKGEDASAGSPDVIILEEDTSEKDVLTVVIDSEDEAETSRKSGTGKTCKEEKGDKTNLEDNAIRKQMEMLRNQIASETDALLFDESTGDKSQVDASRKTPPSESVPSQGLLSPIEEAICSLNKKLKSESMKAQNEEEQRKQEKSNEVSQESSSETQSKKKVQTRTRSSVKGSTKSEGNSNNTEKIEGGAGKASDSSKLQAKNKRFAEELTGKDLFICGNEKCTFAAEDDTELKDHMYVCDLSREYTSLVCPHCSSQIKQFVYYLDHLKHHGEKKYSCGLCSFATAVESSVVKHAKQKHKITQLKSVPNPTKERYLIFYPKNYKLEKQDFATEGYSPGDEDKLPLQAVYQVNVKCAKCPYFTKVRSNMVRHLKIHAKSAETEGSVVVPSTAPTNPVPCLDAKERMFDKMTNLAASSQLAQAKEKTTIEMLTPEEEAKLPQYVAEQMRYKCCLPDCNYITVDDGMLKHHIKALHDEINYYSCPHCRQTVHVDVRHVTLDKIGYHLKHHDNKLYKCAHCIYFHYQKAVVEKHVIEKHPERRYFVHTIREPKVESASEEEHSSGESSSKMWKCGLCDDFRSFARSPVLEHLTKVHNTKSKYKCQLCDMKSNHYHSFFGHFASKHVGEKVAYVRSVVQITSNNAELNSNPSNSDSLKEHFDTTPLWQRGAPRIRHIRGILIEEEEVKAKKSRKASEDKEIESEVLESVAGGDAFYCPLCSDKKKIFCTRNADCFRSHLYQELNYQQFACILCGKMFVDKKDFDKHHAKAHPDKPPSLKQTKEDGEIMFWVDKVIAKQEEQMADKKRRLSGEDSNESQGFSKKKKKTD